MKTKLTELLNIEYPILMAPMFLVSNTKMIIEALKNGITGAIPALNYRSDKELRQAIADIRSHSDKPFGINLIVNKSNPKYKQQLNTLIELKIDFIITSLGNPKEVINRCKPLGIKVFCDVVDLKTAQKVEKLGADAIIAVNRQAGGHSGPYPATRLIPQLKSNCNIPVISAGGVATHQQLIDIIENGADGVSIGTPFIATHECEVSEEYKQAIVDYSGKDIIMTSKISGTPLSVINTPYVQEIGTKETFLEKLMNNKLLKKYIKMLIFNNGMKAIEKSAFKATYKTVWVAGPSIEHINKIQPIKETINQLTNKTDHV